MKLLYITTRISGAGGLQRILSVKTDYLVKKGYEVVIVVTNADDDEMIYNFNDRVEIITITPNRNKLHYFNSYKKHIKSLTDKISPNIVIVCDNGFKGFLVPLILKKIPLIYERHGSRLLELEETGRGILKAINRKVSYYLTGYMASKFDKIVVLNEAAKKEWGFKDIDVIPNPLWFKVTNLSPLDEKIAIAVGRHVYEKGYDRMFEIWSNVIKEHPDWILKIYGKDNPDYDIKALAEHYNISKNVVFEQPQCNIIKAYQEASICLLTSRSEGFGMVLIEAMACGVPCVGYDCPVGPSDIIEDCLNGYLIQDGDKEAFAEKLNLLIEDYKHRQLLGVYAKDSVKRFELNSIMDKWESLFKKLSERQFI
ncbi:glycosyltransferase family 4 protein [Flavobacterium beibuense]|uniref:Glycosyl transferase, group 1 n=1 Tax=Flavobacterium beibuense TaxID=657326 RepID=A0A444W7P5_9FLAO|nr:glycosyltransferase family 4 protein [Flavobacterium beibuense]RYJ41864.1 glycosyl transferase, group 1 [Flavobacterium beibuense]